MAYDENLGERVREILLGEPVLSERKMFGGLAFMLDGHMCCGIVGNELMLRLGAEGAEKALERAENRSGSVALGCLWVSAIPKVAPAA